jgi:hypothetical protein
MTDAAPQPQAMLKLADKALKITLIWGIHQYEVKTITNSTLFKPGQWLSVEQVEALCHNPYWDVAIADDQTFQALLGMVSSHLSALPVP